MNDDPLFEIKDASVNDQTLRDEVDRRAKARDLALPPYPTFGRLAAATQALDDGQLSYHLDEATTRHAAVDVDLDLAPSPATQIPLVGPLWNGIRRQLHEVVLFYVHKLAGHTTAVDHHLLGALGELARRAALQEDELAELRERVAQLEEALAQSDDGSPEEPA